MSCLMVNESIGDAFIDAVMPSFFSSIYVLANALYNISLLAILCPSSAVLGIFLYYRLVYRRAKKSHKEREILLQTRKRDGAFGREEKLLQQKTYMELNRRPRRALRDVGDFIQRLLVTLNDRVVTFITHVSAKRLRKRIAVDCTLAHKWCAMNKPALHQGTMHSNLERDSISAMRLKGVYNADETTNDRHYPVQKRKIVPNPPEITRMVKASHIWWTVDDGQSKSILGSPVRLPSTIVQSTGSLLSSDYPSARKSHRKLRATIFFDTGEALLRIWSNLLITAVNEEGVDNDWTVELFEVPASALLEELQNIFEIFYPDGIRMSELEKEEVCELFSKWIQEHSSDGVCLDSQMISFKAFHSWFYDLSEMIHNSMSDRLLTHILVMTLHSNAASADAVKILNVVAAKHSNSIYKTHISVCPSPVVALSVNTMYTENPFFGSPLISPHTYNPRGHDWIQDIDCQSNDDDLYTTYAQSSLGGQLSDSIYPLNNLGGSPRNFTYPQKIHDVNKSQNLYCAYPEDISGENANPFTHSKRKSSQYPSTSRPSEKDTT